MQHPPKHFKILVFLPQAAGTMIAARLADHGYDAVWVSTVPEAFDALRSEAFGFAITTRPDIDLLRKIRALPVINLEVFLHAPVSSCGVVPGAKRFAAQAFLERVDFLARSMIPARSDTGCATPLPVHGSVISHLRVTLAYPVRIWRSVRNVGDFRA